MDRGVPGRRLPELQSDPGRWELRAEPPVGPGRRARRPPPRTHLAAARPRCGRAERSPALPARLGLERIVLQRRAPGSGCGRQPDLIG